MIIQLKPFFSLPGSTETLSLSRSGDTLTINGDDLDLSIIGEGDLVRDASDLHPYLRDTISRVDGRAHVTLRLPVLRRSGHVDDPAPIIDPPDGPISVPDLSGPEPEIEEAE